MKRLLTVLLLLLIALTICAPGIVGWIAHQRINESLAENWPDARVRWDRGWLESRVQASDDRTHIDIDLDHVPFDLSGWLIATGTLNLAEPETRFDLAGRLGWLGDVLVNVGSDAIALGGPLETELAGLQLRLTLNPTGTFDATLSGDRLSMRADNGPGDRELVVFGAPELTIDWSGTDPATAGLGLTARRTGHGQSRLDLSVRSIERAQMNELVTSLAGAAGAEPGSTRARFGMIGAASAWQQLVAQGIELQLESLELDGQARFDGRWAPRESALRIDGEGAIDPVIEWWATIAALSSGRAIAPVTDDVRGAIDTMGSEPWLTLSQDRFRVDFDSTIELVPTD